jgi:hypothetical protein
MEYLQRVHRSTSLLKLEKLGLLRAADEAAEAVLEQVALEEHERHKLLTASMRAPKAGCDVGVGHVRDDRDHRADTIWRRIALAGGRQHQFMQLAGPTPEWLMLANTDELAHQNPWRICSPQLSARRSNARSAPFS